MQLRTIQLRFELYGKAPAKYGKSAYKAGFAAARLLTRSGWTHVGNGRQYAYVCPPHQIRGLHPIVSVQVPTDDEILAIALEMHRNRDRQIQNVAGFTAYYEPAGTVTVEIPEVRLFDAEHWDKRLEPPPPIRSKFAEFIFGFGAPWSIRLVWEHGNDQPPTWNRCESPTDR